MAQRVTDETIEGTVVRVVADKGFGFVRAQDGQEYFFHRSACDEDITALTEGTVVRFVPTTGPKGLRAERVQRV